MARKQRLATSPIPATPGLYVEFIGEPGFPLALQSLESKKAGIEVVSSQVEELPPEAPVDEPRQVERATVFVPEGQLAHFVERVAKYQTENNPPNKRGEVKPKHQALVASISTVRPALLRSLWTDEPALLPQDGVSIWWEVWLRGEEPAVEQRFRQAASHFGVQVSAQTLHFPERTVLVAFGTPEQMLGPFDVLLLVAELRLAKQLASDFMRLSAKEQADWMRELQERIRLPGSEAPAVCILDTGVNRGHPLLSAALSEQDVHAYNREWRTDDHDGHGTEMAGLALYGDLLEALMSREPVEFVHRLESVKIMPPQPQKNPPGLFGAITADAIAQAELAAPRRPRAVCMAVTATDARDRGQPSSWSAEVDTLCSGARDEQRRLVLVAAGNARGDARHLYPDSNATDGVHDPGQAWNALTVGAVTHKVRITEPDRQGWVPLASSGVLSPSSTTGQIWAKDWPNKPDLVLEGGNMGKSPSGDVDYLDSLSLLTTHRQPAPPFSKPFVVTGDTSAATALASRMAAVLQAAYPSLWPETIRGLLVHSADWTGGLRAQLERATTASEKRALLRQCGYGLPNLHRALLGLPRFRRHLLKQYGGVYGEAKSLHEGVQGRCSPAGA